MTFRVRGYWGVLLALVLIASSGSAAVVRGKMRDVAGRMVLCTGHGPLSVVVDSRGQPVGQLPACPDTIPVMFALGVETPPLIRPISVAFAVVRLSALPLRSGRVAGRVRVRGPPSLFVVV